MAFFSAIATKLSTISSSVRTDKPVPQRGQCRSPKRAYSSRKKGCRPHAVASVELGLRFSRFWPTAIAGPSPVMAWTRAGESRSLNNIGLVYKSLGQYQEALDYCQQSLAIRQEIDDRAGGGVSLYNIGSIYGSLGQYQEALDYYQQSLTIL